MQGNQNPPSVSNPVRVFSAPPKPPTHVLFLGRLQGCITHWTKKGQRWRSVYCPGAAECPTAIHRAGTMFKAYAPAEVWIEAEQVWRPCVFESTANFEHYLRGRSLRGEVWIVHRFDEKGDPNKEPAKNDPVVGAFCERFPESELSIEFPIEPILARFFGVEKVVLGAANPMPAQIVMADVIGRRPITPPDLLPAPEPEEDPHKIAELREQMRRSMQGVGRGRNNVRTGGQQSPGVHTSNGHGHS